jgi:hypothetical protein
MNTVRTVSGFLRPFTLIAAALGGISPYLVTLAKSLVAATPHTNIHFTDLINPEYFVGLILIALIGGVVALFFQETDLRKAFVLGIGAPALISSTFNSAQSSTNTSTSTPSPTPTAMVFPNLITSVYASEPPAAPASEPSININLQSPIPVIVHFLGERGNDVLSAFVRGNSEQITIPPLAKSIRFQAGDNQSTAYPLPEGQSKTFTVTVTGQRKFGFNQSFLNQPPSISYDIAIRPQ